MRTEDIENYAEKHKTLTKAGWRTLYNEDYWVKQEWFDDPKRNVDWCGLSTDKALIAVCRAELNMERQERKESLEMDVKECEIIIMKRTTDLRYAELKLKEAVDELKEHLESAPQ